jgi:putative membrane protein
MLSPASVLIFMLSLMLALPLGVARTASEKGETSKSDTKRDAKASRADQKFIKDAAAGGMMEVELGKIAADKGTNDKVKAFGKRMQEDHGKANDELKKLAADKGVEIPTALEGKHKKTVDRLSKLSGEDFDRQYMRAMVDDHKEDLEKFQREADKGADPAIKQFASKHVPVLKKHLELAQTTNKELRATSKSPTKDSAAGKKDTERGTAK